MAKQNFLFSTIQAFKEAQIIIAAIKLDVFSYLSVPAGADYVAEKLNVKERNTKLVLDSLTAIGLLQKQDGLYCNASDTDFYLNKNNQNYLGEYILFWLDKSSGQDLEKLITSAGQKNPNVFYNFKKMARLTAAEIKTGRSQALLKSLEDIFDASAAYRVLDLGGGSGMLSIELLSRYKKAEAVVFDQASVVEVSETFAGQYGVSDRLKTQAGDFMHDEIGHGFDLLIASGIIDFAKNNLEQFVSKIAKALNENGYLYIVTCGFNEDFTLPRSAIVNWLVGRLQGANVLLPQKEIEAALLGVGFTKISEGIVPSVMQNYLGQLYKFTGGRKN